MSEFFQLSMIPMPPSSNHQYAARSFPGKHAANFKGEKKAGFSMARICPTGDLTRFEKALKETWKNEPGNLVAIYKCRALLREWMLKGLYIHCETIAFFPYFGIYTQEGLPRKMDGTNRLKALHDCMAELLEIDDSWFFKSSVVKAVDTKNREFCVMRFHAYEALTLQQMKENGSI